MTSTSHGKFPLCHWGVLVTELSIVDMKVLILCNGQRWSGLEDTELGVMWELNRTVENLNTVHVYRPFKKSTIRECWNTFSARYMGATEMANERIQLEGIL